MFYNRHRNLSELEYLRSRVRSLTHKLQEAERDRDHYQRSLQQVNAALIMASNQMNKYDWFLFQERTKNLLGNFKEDMMEILTFFEAMGVLLRDPQVEPQIENDVTESSG